MTDEGRIFIALANTPEPGRQHKRGLYELTAPVTGTTASLTPVKGTIAIFPSFQMAPDSALVWLWGADGNDLVVSMGDSRGLSWVKVLATEN